MAEEPTTTPAANQPDSTPAPNTPATEPATAQPSAQTTPAEGATPPAEKDDPLIPIGGEAGTKPNDKPEGDAPTGAPETYTDFTLPDGFKWDDARRGEATTLFKELNLPQASAQKLVDAYCKAVQDQAAANDADLMAARKQWRSEVMNRPDFREQRALMEKGARLLITTDAQRQLLNSWLQDHPAIFDMFVTAGRLVAEDNMVTHNAPPTLTESQINSQRFPNL